MLEPVCLTEIDFDIDIADLLKRLRIDTRPEYAERCTKLARQAIEIARPKAAYGLAQVDSRHDDGVVVDGVRLTSRVLGVNLKDLDRVFPCVMTCGTELEAWSRSISDMLERYWADAIMEDALRTSLNTVTRELAQRYQLGHTAMMNPGSLADWPLEQQRPLFDILGDAATRIGVTLTDSFLMVPVKSASGLFFETQATYENCQLCPRQTCPNRRAPYDAGLYDRRYMAAH